MAKKPEKESKKEQSLEYKPDKPGIEKVLGPLESSIMELVWKRGRVSVREVFEAINSENDKNLAYTTVMTIMGRLAEKNVLKRLKEGGAYVYEAVSSKSEFSSSFVGKVIDSLLEDFSEPALAHFVGKIKDVDPAKLALLEKLIAEQNKKKIDQ